MDDATSAIGETIESVPARAPRPAPKQRVQPLHRRRRAFALLVIAVISLLGGLDAGARGGRALRHDPVHANGYFGGIRALAGTGPASFAAHEQAAEGRALSRTPRYTAYVRVA